MGTFPHICFSSSISLPTVHQIHLHEQIDLSLFVSRSAVPTEHQRGAPKEEFFITDVAYCEQAVIFLKQASLPQNNSQRRKEDCTLPVSPEPLSPRLLMTGKLCKV